MKQHSPVFDFHCHVYPEPIAEKAAHAIGVFYENIEMHGDGRLTSTLEAGRKAGITHHLLCSAATSPAQIHSINSFIASCVATDPEHLFGFGTLHPDSEDVGKDVEEILSLGLRGVKLHPDVQKFALDSPESINMCRAVAGKLPLLVHAGDYRYHYSNPLQIRNLCEALPDLTVIAAHLGGWTQWEEAVKLLPGIPGLYVDTSSALFALSPERATEIIRCYGAGRTFFGVDSPMWDPTEEIARFSRLGLTREEREQILWKNAFAFLGLSPEKPE